MNYRHLFHAGNFADVFKHITLIALLQALSRKETPFCYLDTHAGAGLYDLSQLPKISKKEEREYDAGIGKLMAAEEFPELKLGIIQDYLEIVKSFGYPKFYPGSPLIAKAYLQLYRSSSNSDKNLKIKDQLVKDRMILLELHPEEHHALKTLFRSVPNVSVHLQDGYLGIGAFLPPKERRGLILIDPPFEKPDEWQRIVEAISLGLKKFPNGVYAIWYPIKDKDAVLKFKNDLKNAIIKNYLKSDLLKAPLETFLVEKTMFAELIVYPEDAAFGLIGSGMLMINSPWQLEDTMKDFLPKLHQILSWQGSGRANIASLV